MDPMSDKRAWSRYLDAEASGSSEAAEAALAELFRALPRPAPAAGFAARVMARVARRRSPFALPVVRFGLAASLVAAALGALLIVPMLPGLLGLVEPGSVVSAFVRSLSAATARLAAGAALWQDAAAVGRALGRAVLYPRLPVLFVAQFVIAAAALRALAALASPKRSTHHVAS